MQKTRKKNRPVEAKAADGAGGDSGGPKASRRFIPSGRLFPVEDDIDTCCNEIALAAFDAEVAVPIANVVLRSVSVGIRWQGMKLQRGIAKAADDAAKRKAEIAELKRKLAELEAA